MKTIVRAMRSNTIKISDTLQSTAYAFLGRKVGKLSIELLWWAIEQQLTEKEKQYITKKQFNQACYRLATPCGHGYFSFDLR